MAGFDRSWLGESLADIHNFLAVPLILYRVKEFLAV
jgi:hypothetical protein